MMALDNKLLYFPLLCLALGFFFWHARSKGSFYFLTVAVIYGYIGITYILLSNARELDFVAYMLYFLVSCAGVIAFLMNYKKILKNDAP